MSFAIVWPTIMLAALAFVIWLTLFLARFRHMKANPPGKDTFATGEAAMRYFEPVEMPANNLRNLFEMPVLYFALVPLLLLTGLAGTAQVILAWFFVLFRVAHSYIHVGPNKVQQRFFAYLLSCVMLTAMWVGFAIDFAVWQIAAQ